MTLRLGQLMPRERDIGCSLPDPLRRLKGLCRLNNEYSATSVDSSEPLDGDMPHDHRIDGAVVRRAAALAGNDLVDDVHSADDVAKDRVTTAGQLGPIGDHDEELRSLRIRDPAAIRVGRSGHGDVAARIVADDRIIEDLVARAAAARPLRVAALDHEAGDDAVENDAVVEACLGQV